MKSGVEGEQEVEALSCQITHRPTDRIAADMVSGRVVDYCCSNCGAVIEVNGMAIELVAPTRPGQDPRDKVELPDEYRAEAVLSVTPGRADASANAAVRLARSYSVLATTRAVLLKAIAYVLDRRALLLREPCRQPDIERVGRAERLGELQQLDLCERLDLDDLVRKLEAAPAEASNVEKDSAKPEAAPKEDLYYERTTWEKGDVYAYQARSGTWRASRAAVKLPKR